MFLRMVRVHEEVHWWVMIVIAALFLFLLGIFLLLFVPSRLLLRLSLCLAISSLGLLRFSLWLLLRIFWDSLDMQGLWRFINWHSITTLSMIDIFTWISMRHVLMCSKVSVRIIELMVSWRHKIWISKSKVAMGNMSLVPIMHHSILQKLPSCEMRIHWHSISVILWSKSVRSLSQEWININTSKTVVVLNGHCVMVLSFWEIIVNIMESIVKVGIWTVFWVVIMRHLMMVDLVKIMKRIMMKLIMMRVIDLDQLLFSMMQQVVMFTMM